MSIQSLDGISCRDLLDPFSDVVLWGNALVVVDKCDVWLNTLASERYRAVLCSVTGPACLLFIYNALSGVSARCGVLLVLRGASMSISFDVSCTASFALMAIDASFSLALKPWKASFVWSRSGPGLACQAPSEAQAEPSY